MKDIVLILSSFVGGLFLGYLAAILSFFVSGIAKEGAENPPKFGIPSLFLLSIFGVGLFYLLAVVLENWFLFLGAAMSFIWTAKPLFKQQN